MPRNTLVSGAVIVLLASLLSSCGWIANKLVQGGQSHLVAEPGEAQFDFVRSKAEAFARCVKTWGGRCDTRIAEAKPGDFVQPVKAFRELLDGSKAGMLPELSDVKNQATLSPAVRVLTSPALEKFVDVYNFIAGQAANKLSAAKSDGEAAVFQFTRRELRDFSQDLEDATRFDAFHTIYTKLDQAEKKLESKAPALSDAEKSQLASLKVGKRMAAYIVSYTKAYFRDGEFASVVLDLSQLENAIATRLKTSFPELTLDAQQLNTLVKKLAAGLSQEGGKYRLIGKISETSFKTRGGADYKFPAITATLNPGSREFITVSKVDFVAVGGDMIRVFLEAVGDALAGVPGVSDATGCKIQDLRLPVFDPNNQATNLTVEEFGNVNSYASNVEGVVGSVIGRVIRGVSWFSLNNESVAVLIETAVGVMAKKASEKLIWCGYCVAHQEHPILTEGDPSGITTVVPHGIGRRPGETTVSAKFVVVGEEQFIKE